MATIDERVGALESRVSTLETQQPSSSIVGAITKWLGDNPVIAHAMNAVISAALGALLAWLGGLGGSVKTVEVPGPERTIIREVPAKDQPAGTAKTGEGPPK